MKGHLKLIAMRQAGRKPTIVFLNDYPTNPEELNWDNPGETFGKDWGPSPVTICTHGDDIETLDLRFLAGCTVTISATEEDRAKKLFGAVKASGAKTVAAVHVQAGTHPRLQSGWTEIYHKETTV
jgi:hypothetical protein